MTTSSTNTPTTPMPGTGATGRSVGEQDSTTDQAKQAAATAQDEARQVAADVREQARGLLTETRTQVEDQSRTQRDRLVETIRTFSDDLDQMAAERGGLASDAAREVATRARAFGSQIDGREPAELLDDLRAFARRRPALFLAGSMAAGVVVGRVLRGSRDAAQNGTSTVGAADTRRALTQSGPVGSPYAATSAGIGAATPAAGDPTPTTGAMDPTPASGAHGDPVTPSVTSTGPGAAIGTTTGTSDVPGRPAGGL